jgi:hypothetical protein
VREVTRVEIPGLPAPVIDIDGDEHGRYVALLGDAVRVYSQALRRDIIQGYENLQILFSSGGIVPAPVPLLSPLIRMLEDGAIVTNKNGGGTTILRPNAEAGFLRIGDCIENLLVVGPRLVVAYFDEGVLGGLSPADEGVAVFEQDGSMIFGYHSVFGYDEAQIYDAYATCGLDDWRIAICSYGKNPSFPLILLDFEKSSRQIYPTPEPLHGSSALTLEADDVIFWSPYKDKTGIYRWRIGNENYDRIGEHEGSLRGLTGGRFLSKRPDGYSIYDAKA